MFKLKTLQEQCMKKLIDTYGPQTITMLPNHLKIKKELILEDHWWKNSQERWLTDNSKITQLPPEIKVVIPDEINHPNRSYYNQTDALEYQFLIFADDFVQIMDKKRFNYEHLKIERDYDKQIYEIQQKKHMHLQEFTRERYRTLRRAGIMKKCIKKNFQNKYFLRHVLTNEINERYAKRFKRTISNNVYSNEGTKETEKFWIQHKNYLIEKLLDSDDFDLEDLNGI